MAINMTNQEMVLTSLGFFKNDYKLDNFRSNFGYDWTDEDLNEADGDRCFVIEFLFGQTVDNIHSLYIYASSG